MSSRLVIRSSVFTYSNGVAVVVAAAASNPLICINISDYRAGISTESLSMCLIAMGSILKWQSLYLRLITMLGSWGGVGEKRVCA